MTAWQKRTTLCLSVGAAALILAPSAPGQSMDSRVCAGCHRKIWDTYRQTGMGRSFFRPAAVNAIEDYAKNNPFYHRPSDSYFEMLMRDGQYYQRRYQLDPAGKQVNAMEKRIDYIMGSGNHARAYLHRTAANTLIELPLGWYSEKGGYWAMSPGYDRPNHDGFRRLINYDCMFCHNAYPGIPTGRETAFSDAVYTGAMPEGINCERCHGGGARHVQIAGTAGAKREAIRSAIVNPARLTAERQMEICMTCHLEATSFPLPNAIVRYHRGPFSFQPGEPIGDYILNFDHAPGMGRDDKFEIVNAVYRLRKSACFLKSAGKMTCTTCHNPHDIPRGEAADRHYTAVCRQCHAQGLDARIAAGAHTRDAVCTGCHMPKRRTEDVVHSPATDHLIQRRKPEGDLLAERPERHETETTKYRGPVVLYYPETLADAAEKDLYLAVAQVKQGSNLKEGIPQLTAAIAKHQPRRAEFYLELAEALENNGQIGEAVPVYREAVRRNPGFAVAWQRLGTALRRLDRNPESADALKRALSANPGSAVTWHESGLTWRALGNISEAVSAIGKAITLDPDLPEAHNNLGIILLARGESARAETEFRTAIRIRTDYADAHGNLANLLSGSGRLDEARWQFEIALRLRPGDAATRFSYAMLLGRTSHYEEAQRELEASLRADAGFADAHEVLGDLLMAKGQTREAASHYRAAIRIRPDSRAHLGLAEALAAAGDVRGAIPHLEQAARSPDARARERAAELLRQLGSRR